MFEFQAKVKFDECGVVLPTSKQKIVYCARNENRLEISMAFHETRVIHSVI